jgi:hypothetical protein
MSATHRMATTTGFTNRGTVAVPANVRDLLAGAPPANCGFVDVLLGLRTDGHFTIAAEQDDARRLLTELRLCLPLLANQLTLEPHADGWLLRVRDRVSGDA